MNCCFVFALFAVAVPLATASYAAGPQAVPGLILPQASGIENIVNVATGGNPAATSSITSTAEVAPSPAEAARLRNAQAQLRALNNNPTYQNVRASDDIQESLATSDLEQKIRRGNINIVAPNVVDQGVFRSLLVPSGRNNHQVIATPTLPAIVVNQPGAPTAQISSGPPAVVRAAPVIYKIRPSVIYQQEVINKVPTPLSLNPVYVKVYKPSKKVDVPIAPAVAPVYSKGGYGHGPAAVDSYAQPSVAQGY